VEGGIRYGADIQVMRRQASIVWCTLARNENVTAWIKKRSPLLHYIAWIDKIIPALCVVLYLEKNHTLRDVYI